MAARSVKEPESMLEAVNLSVTEAVKTGKTIVLTVQNLKYCGSTVRYPSNSCRMRKHCQWECVAREETFSSTLRSPSPNFSTILHDFMLWFCGFILFLFRTIVLWGFRARFFLLFCLLTGCSGRVMLECLWGRG